MSTSSNEVAPRVADTSHVAPALSRVAGLIALITSVVTLLFLAFLHILSPEFDPSWRMVSEYALGNYGWLLSLMFAVWALSSWALVLSIWSKVRTIGGKIGLFFLVITGIGEAMASVFDIRHPLHEMAGMIGILSLPIAAMLISVSLSHTEEWSAVKKALLWTANLTWASVLLLIATFILMIVTFTQTGNQVDPRVTVTVLPEGVIAYVGWANRILVVVYCVWVITVAWLDEKVTRSISY
jgi:hypothetical protein